MNPLVNYFRRAQFWCNKCNCGIFDDISLYPQANLKSGMLEIGHHGEIESFEMDAPEADPIDQKAYVIHCFEHETE